MSPFSLWSACPGDLTQNEATHAGICRDMMQNEVAAVALYRCWIQNESDNVGVYQHFLARSAVPSPPFMKCTRDFIENPIQEYQVTHVPWLE